MDAVDLNINVDELNFPVDGIPEPFTSTKGATMYSASGNLVVGQSASGNLVVSATGSGLVTVTVSNG